MFVWDYITRYKKDMVRLFMAFIFFFFFILPYDNSKSAQLIYSLADVDPILEDFKNLYKSRIAL